MKLEAIAVPEFIGPMTRGDAIQYMRCAAGYSARQVASYLNYSHVTYGEKERGRRVVLDEDIQWVSRLWEEKGCPEWHPKQLVIVA